MKLFVQINVAFGVLLVLVLSMTAVIFHYVLLDHFIKVQKNDMQQMSATLSMHMQALPGAIAVGGGAVLRTLDPSTSVPPGSVPSTTVGSDSDPSTFVSKDSEPSEFVGSDTDPSKAHPSDDISSTVDAHTKAASASASETTVPPPPASPTTAFSPADPALAKPSSAESSTAPTFMSSALFPVAVSAISATPIAGVEAVITDHEANIIFSTVPLASFQRVSAVELKTETALSGGVRLLGEGKDNDQFLVTSNEVNDGTLTLFMPMSKIKAIEQAVLWRLLLVLCVGGVFVFLLSLVITRRLIKPLMKLRGELRKVESRRFSEVELVRAGGEIGDVAHTVYEMAGELEKYNRIQKQFIQNASHELKTPLMSIAGYAEGIRDGIFEGESVRKGLDIIISESGRLKNIVTEMTLLAKLDGEEDIFRLSPVCIADIVNETIERINPLLVKNGQTISTSFADERAGACLIQADRDKLLQALLNVVSNATRYARKEIRIHVGYVDNRVDLSVTDDGAGIPHELLPHLFHRFVKGKDGETGLGLAIARAIVERCGGRIAARNRQNGGASVSMRFPAAS